MKKLTLLACLLTSGAIFPAFAEDMDMNDMMMKMNDMQMKDADANKDGTTTEAEKKAYTEKMMMMYDNSPKDGKMSKAEMDMMMMKQMEMMKK